MINWLRHNFVASLLLTVARIYLGIHWLLDGWSKINASPDYSAHGIINGAINGGVQNVSPATGQMYPLWTKFLELITNNGNDTAVIDAVIKYGTFAIGILLVLGLLTIPATFFSLIFSFAFILSGVISFNPIIILLSFIILMSGFNAAKLGIDRWLTPWFRLHLPFLRNNAANEAKIEKAID